MKRFFLPALLLIQIFGCKTQDTPAVPASQVVDALHQQFHGQYRIVSAVSNEALDVNLDGQASTNLLTEIDELTTGTLTSPYAQIRIHKPSQANPEPTFTFIQNWPAQFLRLGGGKVWDGVEMLPFNSAYSFAYDMKVVIRKLTFSDDLRELTAIADESEETVYRQSLPKSITVLDSGEIVVVATRRIYTSQGVKEVTVTTTYERFTMKI